MNRSATQNFTKKERHFCSEIFTKLSQNSHTFWSIDKLDVTAIYGKPLDFIAFFWVFSYIIDDHSFLKCCISTKLSQIVCPIIVHILVCQNVKCVYRLRMVLWFNCVFWEFSYISTCLKRYNFTKHLKIIRQKYKDE